jgi:hypothetical protein
MSGRLFITVPASDFKLTYALHARDHGPVTELYLGREGAPAFVTLECLEDFDDAIRVLVAARADHGEAQARYAARPLVPEPLRVPVHQVGPGIYEGEFDPGEPGRRAVIPVPGGEPLIDPDCIAGKHPSCVGDPCQCACHEPADAEPLQHRAPGPAPEGEPTCDERDGHWACTANPLHAGDHAAHDRDGNVRHQWQREPA